MERHEHIHKNWHEIFINNFLGGAAWGFGATVGASILLGLFGIILSKINLIPFFGQFVSQITNFVIANNPNLIK